MGSPDFSFSVAGNPKLGKTLNPGIRIDYIHRQAGGDRSTSNQHAAAKTINAFG